MNKNSSDNLAPIANSNNGKINFAFFGSSYFSTIILDKLKSLGYLPNLIITTEDKPQGRNMEVKGTVVKDWAKLNNIPLLSPESIKVPQGESEVINALKKYNIDISVVASYGKIIPNSIINEPRYKTLNIHPSLLPLYRGASPVQSQILNDDHNTGVTIIELDKEMDHGPIVYQKKIKPDVWPISTGELKKILGEAGALAISEIFNAGLNKISKVEQEHGRATFTKKFKKEEGFLGYFKNNQFFDPNNQLLNSDTAKKILLKILAFNGSPKTYMIDKSDDNNQVRITIKSAEIKDGIFLPIKVIPESKKEMNWSEYLRGKHRK